MAEGSLTQRVMAGPVGSDPNSVRTPKAFSRWLDLNLIGDAIRLLAFCDILWAYDWPGGPEGLG